VGLAIADSLFMLEKKAQTIISIFSILSLLIFFATYYYIAPQKLKFITEDSIRANSFIMFGSLLLIKCIKDQNKKIEISLFNDLNDHCEIVDKQSKERETFFACMSHEIRNPTQAIVGALELLIPAIQKSPENLRLMDIAKSGCEIVMNLISNILDLSKIKANKMELSLAPCNLRETIMKVVRLNRQKAEGKGLYLKYCDSEIPFPPALELDSRKISQVLLNLISNSIKFTQSGGITVTASWEWDDEENKSDETSVPNERQTPTPLHQKYKKELFGSVRFKDTLKTVEYGCRTDDESYVDENQKLNSTSYSPNINKKSGYAKIIVSDTGIGIQEAAISKLFQAFNQADSSISGYFYIHLKTLKTLWWYWARTMDIKKYTATYEWKNFSEINIRARISVHYKFPSKSVLGN